MEPNLESEQRRGPAEPEGREHEAPRERVDLHLYFHLDEALARQIVVLFSAQFKAINTKLETIMAKQSDAAVTLTQQAAKLDTISDEVDKVSAETTALVKAVADLTAAAGNSDTTPEMDAALAAVQASSDRLATKVKGVDDLVADAVVTPPADGGSTPAAG